jgi:TolA-binding protein
MTQQLKIAAYAVLLGLAVWFGYNFVSNLRASNAPAQPVEPTNQISAVDTNTEATNAVVTNQVAVTNAAEVAATNGSNVATIAPKRKQPTVAAPPLTRAERTSRALAWGAGLFVVILCFGLLIAHDFSHFAANKFQKFIFDDDLEGIKDPEYEQAEKIWANGNFLEAIQLMRDYLKAHPREQYVAIRIAEIYEKDLGNYLAAALEYEEILKKKLPDQRWGWAAIHLANLYSGKLNRGHDAIAMLQRIVAEYGHTAAAKKARERLTAEGIAIPEPVMAEEPMAEEAEPEQPPETPAEPPSNLPPGFRPKK